MPTITIYKNELDRLLGHPVSVEAFEEQLALVKGELDDFDPATGELRVELNDTNRPDLWCVEGIVRQIMAHETGHGREYPFFETAPEARFQVVVDKSVGEVRPYVGACISRGVVVDDALLTQLIQTQEKICDIFGQKRKSVAIGIYDADRIVFPVHYTAVNPSDYAFVPLGMEAPMTLAEIVAIHPKGQKYGPIVADYGRWPLLRDNVGTVLSFPPVINSSTVGEVKIGDCDLFMEVTGTDLNMVALAINMLAANMADRGARIEAVKTVYPEATDLGTEVVHPRPSGRAVEVALADFSGALGEVADAQAVARHLVAYGHRVEVGENRLTVRCPAYRDDVMHPVDIIEDYAISRGYAAFDPEMPAEATVGGLEPLERCSDQVRQLMIGMGFQEVLSNILVSRRELADNMELHGVTLVSVANPMTHSYSVLRNAVLPSLLKVEAQSGRAFYPHALFEVGEVAIFDNDAPMGSQTRTNLAVLLAHAEANFSELAARLEMLCYYLGATYQLEPVDHASYISGRAGRIVVNRWDVGIIGELSPVVLEHWGITVPCAGFEIDLTELLR